MGKKDTLAKKYISDNSRFADAFNYYLFNGEQVIRPEDLKEMDSTEMAAIPKRGGSFAKQKIRDVMKHVAIRKSPIATLALLGIENQTDVHYAMAVRNMLYDALNYTDQVDSICIRNRESKNSGSSAEFMSGIMKNDRLLTQGGS